MAIPAISVLANVAGQAMLFREGGWGEVPPAVLEARGSPMGVALLADGRVIGLAPKSAMSSLAASREFYLGAVQAGVVRQVAKAELVVRHGPAAPSAAGLRP